jgi:hypothetical protein
MSRGLPEAVRKYLDEIDQSEAIWESIDLDDLRAQIATLMNLYQAIPPIMLARLIMEQVVALDAVLVRGAAEGGNLEAEVKQMKLNASILAAALSRRGRGKPLL